MPIDPLTALGIFGQGANMILQNETNKKNRNFTREMYQTQRRDALSDWEMQNAYNSPAAQMERFKGAGLNPNLIYGQMQTAQPIRSSSSSGGQASAPQVDTDKISNSLMLQYEMKQRQASTDLLGKQLLIADEEVKLKKAQTIASLATSGLTEARQREVLYNMGYKEYFRDITMEGKEQGLEKGKAEIANLNARTTLTLDSNERAAAMQAGNLTQQLEAIAKIKVENKRTAASIDEIKQRIENMKKDGTIKDYEIKLNSMGIQKGDKLWERLLIQALERLLGTVSSANEPNGRWHPLKVPYGLDTVNYDPKTGKRKK